MALVVNWVILTIVTSRAGAAIMGRLMIVRMGRLRCKAALLVRASTVM